MTSSTSTLQLRLTSALPFLRGEFSSVSPKLPSLISVLQSVGAGECWHKHGSFLVHLIEVYRILKLWSAPDDVALCGLFHSAYSNSYVNLAIFDPNTSRSYVSSLIGPQAERLVHLFCVVNRQTLIHDDLLFNYRDQVQLMTHLRLSEDSVRKGREKLEFDSEEEWRKKINSVLPVDGVVVKNIKTGEDVKVSRRVVGTFLLMTMVDFSDQLFGWQDQLFENGNGLLEYAGNNPTAVWPGNGKPGLWLNSISRMGAVYNLIAREEEIYMLERNQNASKCDRDEDLELVIPPVFENCSRIIGTEEQMTSRELYWEAVCGGAEGVGERVEELLLRCIEKNPFVGEPRMVLAQVYLGKKRFEEAKMEAENGLRLLLEWGSSWDKRMTWEAWVAWGRVLIMKSKEKEWPQTAWGILNLGLVN